MEVMLVTLVVAPIVLIGLMRFGERRNAQMAGRGKRRAIAAGWRNGSPGGFPSDASGQRIAALAGAVKSARSQR